MIALAVVWLVVAPVAAVVVGKTFRRRNEAAGYTREMDDAAQAAWLDARKAGDRSWW